MNSPRPMYCFDLDGTVLAGEVLPRLAEEVGLADEMRLLTALTMQGKIPFDASFGLRCRLLRDIPLERAQEIAAEVPVEPAIVGFIDSRPEDCVIVTSNLDVWVRKAVERLGCAAATSEAFVVDGALVDVATILDKGAVVAELQERYQRPVIAVGDGANDVPMLRQADIAIGFAGLNPLADPVAEVIDHVAWSGTELVAYLGQDLFPALGV